MSKLIRYDVRSISGKRILDVVCALIALVVSAPLLIVSAAAVWASIGRPVIFRQERCGLNGEHFTILKLRTMRNGNEADGKRLTRLGRFLRSTSLDELPELVNVLKGEMSLVGPRPLPAEYWDRYSPIEKRRHEVLPGVTGLAQVSGRNLVDWEDRFALDLEYVRNQSLRLDLRILALTVLRVAQMDGIAAIGSDTMPAFVGSSKPVADSLETEVDRFGASEIDTEHDTISLSGDNW